jgi:hypothetical protein
MNEQCLVLGRRVVLGKSARMVPVRGSQSKGEGMTLWYGQGLRASPPGECKCRSRQVLQVAACREGWQLPLYRGDVRERERKVGINVLHA